MRARPRGRGARARRFALALTLPLPGVVACTPRPAASAPRVYETRGTIRSFGPGRLFANIEHEAIDGYMAAMTMSFEAGEAGQLDAFREGQRVAFSFSDDDGRRVLRTIRDAAK